MELILKIKKLNESAVLPEYKTSGAVGMDLCSLEEKFLSPGCRRAFGTGLAFEVPEGYEGTVRGRSGLAFNKGVFAIKGTIDPDFRGEVRILLYNSSSELFHVKVGDRIAQIVFSPVAKASLEVVEELETTDRGEGGLGSTGV